MRSLRKFLFVPVLIITLGLAAWALMAIFPGPAPAALYLYNDSLSWSTGLTVGSRWAVTGTSLTWQITNPSPGVWHYQYTWDVGDRGKGNLSHFLLEVTNPARAVDFFNFTNAALSSDDPKTYAAKTPPDFEMPYALYGIKFTAPGGGGWNALDVTFGFDSTHRPTWGDFFARDGTNAYAYNKGFSSQGVSLTLNDGLHVAVPNGFGSPVPLPAASWLLGSGLIGLVGVRRRCLKSGV